MKTDENLKSAFAGESQANRRYLAYAEKAQEEGFVQVAKLFKATAESEAVHAMSHLRVMRAIKSTLNNLKKALEGEVHEHTKMYPEFMQTAVSEKRRDAEITFKWANEVERVHADYYQEAINAVSSGEDLAPLEYYVCQVCGFTAKKNAPETCPVCGSPKRLFKAVV